jgi:hypothetical protein
VKQEISPYETRQEMYTDNSWKPMTVYFLHFIDDRFFLNNWNKARDYACCVMARTQKEAIEKTMKIAMKDPNAKHVKILGIGHGKEEWVDEEKPLRSDPAYYERISARALAAAKENKINLFEKVKYKYD